jgi:S1-C subfamily serine protease
VLAVGLIGLGLLIWRLGLLLAQNRLSLRRAVANSPLGWLLDSIVAIHNSLTHDEVQGLEGQLAVLGGLVALVAVGWLVYSVRRLLAERRPVRLGLRVRDTADGTGAAVGQVRPDSAAARAGIAPGDVIEVFAGKPVKGAAELEQAVRNRAGDVEPTIVVRRRGQRLVRRLED